MKKIIIATLCLFLAFSSIISAASFRDVPSTHTFYKNIESLKSQNVVDGYANGNFGVDDFINRGQMAKLVVNGLNMSIYTDCSRFGDIEEEDTFFVYIQTLKCNGIVTGYSDNTFRTDSNLTRAEATKFVIAGAKAVKGDEDYFDSISNNIFSDVTPNYNLSEYIYSAYSHGIINGYSDGRFRPNNFITRGEMSKIIDITRQKVFSTNSCIYYGNQYIEGDSFNAVDNCNKCICSNSEVKCTFNVCVNTVDYTVTLNNYTFNPRTIHARAGRKLNIKLVNQFGYHNFVIDELGVSSKNLSTGEELIIQIDIPANASGKEYQFYSNIADQKARGMTGFIIVN